MVSERFLKLDKEKQERILSAARREFSRVPYEQVSINQIIKDAGISRGSFYTYFDDKEDLLMYFYGQQGKTAIHSIQSQLLECQGDIWEALKLWVDQAISYRRLPEVQQTINVLLNGSLVHRPKQPHFDMIEIRKQDEEQEFQWFLEHVDGESFDLSRPEAEIRMVYRMLLKTAMMTLADILVGPGEEELEKNLNYYHMQLEVIRRGYNYYLKSA